MLLLLVILDRKYKYSNFLLKLKNKIQPKEIKYNRCSIHFVDKNIHRKKAYEQEMSKTFIQYKDVACYTYSMKDRNRQYLIK